MAAREPSGARHLTCPAGTAEGELVRAAGAAAGAGGRRVARLVVGGALEGVTAAAGCDRVRVVDLEPGLLDRLEVVDAAPAQVRGAERIDHNRDALALELVVALLGAAVEAEAVLEAGAAAALDRHAEHRDLGVLRHERADLGRRGRRQRDQAFGALLELHRGRMVPTREAAAEMRQRLT